jgi:AraC-like DNA-binding protein
MSTPSTPAQYIIILIDMMEEQGCDRERLLAGCSLEASGINNIGARVSDFDFRQVVANAQSLTGDAALGLKLGLRLHLSAHAVLGQAFMTCTDLGQVVELLLKYYHLLSTGLHLEYEVVDENCVLTIIATPGEINVQFGFELLYGAFINTVRGMLNDPEISVRMELPYPKPEHADAYYRVLGEDIHFNCLRGRIVFDRSWLDTQLPSSNPALRQLYEAECARLLTDLKLEDSVSERTLKLLRKLEGQYPQMPQIANMLNLSPRTYRRRLDEEDQSFQKLLDQVRSEHATRYLQNTRLPLSTIAYLVGFSDASNFRRAYIKWTGTPPSKVRTHQVRNA